VEDPVLTGDGATVTAFVAVPPADAFAVFTGEVDAWWGQGPRFRIGGRHPGRLAFSPGPGGRLTETVDLPGGARTFVVGTITVWEPPSRLAFEWRGVNFAPGETTTVDVTFRAQGAGTLVTVRHTGFASLRDDHPARHGEVGAAFSRTLGLWWGELMSSLREHVAGRGGAW
jgi:uncharacterized protein YndB with AHSA1/START domain